MNSENIEAETKKNLDLFSNNWLAKTKEIDSSRPAQLYHYTKNDAFISMVDNKELWATHIRYLNDYSEIWYALQMASHIADSLSQTYTGSSSQTFISIIKNSAGFYFDFNIYIVSLSEKKDLLSQWRGYGDKYKSICLGFNTDSMILNSDENPLIMNMLHKVEYDPIKQENIIRDFIEGYLKIIDSIPLANISSDFPIRLLNLMQFLVRIKDPSWKEEAEWRLVFLDEEITHYTDVSKCIYRERNYRAGTNSIIPFVKAKVYPGKMSISEIIVPQHATFLENKKAIDMLLIDKKYPAIPVSPSSIPIVY